MKYKIDDVLVVNVNGNLIQLFLDGFSPDGLLHVTGLDGKSGGIIDESMILHVIPKPDNVVFLNRFKLKKMLINNGVHA